MPVTTSEEITKPDVLSLDDEDTENTEQSAQSEMRDKNVRLDILKVGIHPLADLMPQMSDDDYKRLKIDVSTKGRVHEPIILLDGKVLDGRHRKQTIEDIWNEEGKDVDYTTEDYDEKVHGDPREYVMSKGLMRRHLTFEQKAIIALGYKRSIQAERAAGKKVKKGAETEKLSGDARDLAAARLGISGKAVDIVDKLEKAAPDVFERVKAGDITVWAAGKELDRRNNEADHNSGKSKKAGDALSEFVWKVCHQSALVTTDKPIKVDVWIYENHVGDGKIEYAGICEQAGTNPVISTSFTSKNLAEAKREAVAFFVMVNTPEAPAVEPVKDEDNQSEAQQTEDQAGNITGKEQVSTDDNPFD